MKDKIPAPEKGRFPIFPIEDIVKNQRQIEYIAIHCAATPPDMYVDAARVTEWHKKRGFNTIGYHLFIKRDGTAELGRPVYKTGAHVKGYNSVSIGICYAGGVDKNGKAEDNRTEAQKKTLEKAVRELRNHYTEAKIRGHRDFKGVAKACPSFSVREWVRTLGLDPK
jgi:N-acetylmuramoyl-L-alanine amidase